MYYIAAIDLSGPEAAFALATGKNKNRESIICEKYLPMKGRDASKLGAWILSILSEYNISPQQIKKWINGSGPGSFTGLRLTASLVKGISFGRNIETCNLPSGTAMAMQVESNAANKIAVLFDGRNKELILFEAENQNGKVIFTGKTKIINSTSCEKELSDYQLFTAMEKDKKAIANILPANYLKKISFLEHFPIKNLILCEDRENFSREMIYIRPAVFSKPVKEHRKINF